MNKCGRRKMGRRVKNKRRNGGRGRREWQTEGRGKKVQRREERGAAKRASGGGGKRRGVWQGKEVRENRSDWQEVNGRSGRRRRKKKDRGGSGDSRRRGERERGRGGRSSMKGCDMLRRLRTQGERRRPEKLWSYYNYHKSQETKKIEDNS